MALVGRRIENSLTIDEAASGVRRPERARLAQAGRQDDARAENVVVRGGLRRVTREEGHALQNGQQQGEEQQG